MSVTVRCLEPGRRPPLSTAQVEEGRALDLWLLDDAGAAEGGLRATILRRADELPPKGAQLLLSLRVEAPPGGKGMQLRVQRVNAALPVEQARGDLRSRVAAGGVVHGNARLDVQPPGRRRVSFTLAVEDAGDAARPEAAVGTSGVGESEVVAHSAGALWLVPPAFSVIQDLTDWTVNQLRAIAQRFGLSTRTIAWLVMAGMYITFSLFAFRDQYNKRLAAEEAQAAAEGEAAAAAAAAQSALLAEVTCLAERADLVEALGDAGARHRYLAEVALAPSASRAVALEMGGARMGTEAVLSRDDKAFDTLLAAVVAGLDAAQGAPPELRRCQGFEQLLGYDLPAYALSWSAVPGVVCPSDYTSIDDGILHAGRWALSTRAATEFGAALPQTAEGGIVSQRLAEALSDPRMEDRWSANTHATGLRAVTQKMLIARPGGRLPVLPSQAQAWGLALWGAANTLPSPAEGMLDAPIEECVEVLLADLARASATPEPDAPLLPSFEQVASGKVEVPVRATAGCPWPRDAVSRGASLAMQAIITHARSAAQPQEVD